jgi:hypothetical protein
MLEWKNIEITEDGLIHVESLQGCRSAEAEVANAQGTVHP